MKPTTQTPSGVEAGATAQVSPKKPLRFTVGVGLLILYPLMWLAAPVIPFLPLDTATKAAIVTADVVAAEVLLLIGIACVGKEAYQAMTARFRRKKPGAEPTKE